MVFNLSADQAAREREEFNAAIRAGLADIDAGRLQAFDEFEQEMREKYNIPATGINS